LGRVCVNGRGGGQKRKYRVVDYFRRICVKGRLMRICYDRGRSAFLGLILYDNGLLSYLILSNGLKIGNTIFSGPLEKTMLVKNLG